MLTDPKLRSQVDQLWDTLWTGGLNNPMDAIEQFSYLLFLKRLDDSESQKERQASRNGTVYVPGIPEENRWRTWTKYTAEKAVEHVQTKVFPWLRDLGGEGSSFAAYMASAEFKIKTPRLLIQACNQIDAMHISELNQDMQGDLYEYMLNRLNVSGRNGQFRTPRHIIQMMVRMVDPKPGERIADMAAGTCGFLVNAYQYMLAQHTSPEILQPAPNGDGWGSPLIGDQLTDRERGFLQADAFEGYDNDAGMTMLRIGSMNMMLHGIDSPKFFYKDTLSKEFDVRNTYQVVLMNPPFKGKVDKGGMAEDLPDSTTKSELLFVHLILKALDNGGRCAVIVPDGVLFGSTRGHVALRKAIVEENRLDGIVSMPGGVFKPYSGVSTAVLFFTKGAKTDRIWFYDMAADGFSLDDKRLPTGENDIPNILECWQNRSDPAFDEAREVRKTELESQLAPLWVEWLRIQGEINCLRFETAIAPDHVAPEEEDEEKPEPEISELERVEQELADLDGQMAPLKAQLDQLNRQFWVTRAQVKANKYNLSASRYRQTRQDSVFYERPQITLDRLSVLEESALATIQDLQRLTE